MSFIAAAVITGSAMLGATAMSTFGGKRGSLPTYNLPDFPEDPYVGKAQDILYPFGRDLLAGDIPEYYKPIGEIGGELFEDVLGLGIKDIQTAGIETAARLGQRGGGVAPGIAREVGEYTQRARFDDYMRALKGRGFLLESGANIVGGVRGAALTGQAQKAGYEVSKGSLALGYAGLASEIEIGEAKAKGAAIGSGIAGLSNLYANYQLGRVDPGISSVYDTGGYTPDSSYLDQQGLWFGNWGSGQARL